MSKTFESTTEKLRSPLTFSIFERQRLLDEVRRLLKVHADVEVVRVAGWYAVVDDARAGIEVDIGVDVHEGVSLRGIQDVGDALPLETHHVHRHKPASEWQAEQIHAIQLRLHILLTLSVCDIKQNTMLGICFMLR